MPTPSIVPLARDGTVTKTISSQLIRLITDGHWKPGERLPSEFELASRFQAGAPKMAEESRLDAPETVDIKDL